MTLFWDTIRHRLVSLVVKLQNRLISRTVTLLCVVSRPTIVLTLPTIEGRTFLAGLLRTSRWGWSVSVWLTVNRRRRLFERLLLWCRPTRSSIGNSLQTKVGILWVLVFGKCDSFTNRPLLMSSWVKTLWFRGIQVTFVRICRRGPSLSTAPFL